MLLFLLVLAIIECDIKTFKSKYQICHSKPNPVGPSLWSCIRFDSYTTWKKKSEHIQTQYCLHWRENQIRVRDRDSIL